MCANKSRSHPQKRRIEKQGKSADKIVPSIQVKDDTECIVGDSFFFRYELIASMLSNKPIILRLERAITSPEINFLHFLDRLSEGTKFEVSEDAMTVKVSPGVIIGGSFTHECVPERGIGFWAEAASLLCPFGKNPSKITFLSCVTNCSADIGYDLLRTVTIPLLRRFGIEASIQLIKRFCMAKNGTSDGPVDGSVVFSVDNVRVLQEIQPVMKGFIKRIRGVAFGVRVAPDICNQLATFAKGLLLKLVPDIYILTDIDKKGQVAEVRKASSGFGLCLVSESTSKNAVCSAEAVASHRKAPEDVAKRCVNALLHEIHHGGLIDRAHQAMTIFLMGLAVDLPSVAHVGQTLTPSTCYLLQHIMPTVFHVKYMQRTRTDEASCTYQEIVCIGSRLVNSYKKST